MVSLVRVGVHTTMRMLWNYKHRKNVGQNTRHKTGKYNYQEPHYSQKYRVDGKKLTKTPTDTCKYFIVITSIEPFRFHMPMLANLHNKSCPEGQLSKTLSVQANS